MNKGSFAFGIILLIIGAIGIGNSLLAPYFSATPPLTWGRTEKYIPSRWDRLVAISVSLLIFAYGIWLTLPTSPK